MTNSPASHSPLTHQPPATPQGLARLNAMSAAEAAAALTVVCGSKRWAAAMTGNRPFQQLDALIQTADSIWFALSPADWTEAFAHHPRIGETNLAQARFAKTAQQSSIEQSGMSGASDEVRRAFVAGNAEYERKFGHVFLICATGKSGAFMLDQLGKRLKNDAATELHQAAREQAMITRMRLTKLVNS